jgi:choline dehydrogenase-like flavoprotein
MGIYETLTKQLADIQSTKFSIDAIGSRICSSWDTVAAHRFDIVVIGASMFGAYCAEKLFRLRRDTSKQLRILVLDAGPFLLPTHANDLPLRGMNDGFVWARPWTGNDDYIKDSGLAFCVGGRSLFWAGWSPKLMPDDLDKWPADVRDFLNSPLGYDHTAAEIGSDQKTDFIEQTVTYKRLWEALQAAKGDFSGARIDLIERAPLAVMGSRPRGGVFPFDQFSSVTFLIDAINQDVSDSQNNPWDRRLMLLPRAEVIGLTLDDKKAVTSLELEVAGDPKTLPLGPDTTVILANGTVEATRLALAHLGVGKQASGQPPKVGNFMAHMGNSLIVRIRRSVLGLDNATQLDQVAAFMARGKVSEPKPERRFHYQIVAAALQQEGQTPWDFVMRLLPDIDELDRFIAGRDPEWISIVFRGIGEMEGDLSLDTAGARRNSIRLEQGGRAYAELIPSAKDDALWSTMFRVAIDLANKLAKEPKNLEYWWWSDRQWHPDPPAESRDGIGSSQHEGGTLFMGEVGKSITDADGKFHHLPNVYVVGPAVFPTIGDANPSLTGLTLARRTAKAIARRTPIA